MCPNYDSTRRQVLAFLNRRRCASRAVDQYIGRCGVPALRGGLDQARRGRGQENLGCRFALALIDRCEVCSNDALTSAEIHHGGPDGPGGLAPG